MGTGMIKAERLQEMKRLYVQRAFTDIEMAERLGVVRETVYRDRIELTTEYPIQQDAEGRYRIDRSRLLSEIKVNLHEALTLYLAARKTSRQMRFHQPHAASALEKLAATLRQPMTERLLKAADRLLKQEKAPERIKILETVTQAWVEQRKVRIRYQGLKSVGVTNHVIHSYLIEPSIWSDSVYVVAYSEMFEKVMPFKIDRIDAAALSGETFDIPDGFDEQELLEHAWGIWTGERAPQPVRLRFAPAVRRRVKESIWHPLETVTDTEDGGCIWEAPIAEWQEMLPWVRGWGADVEVLEPEELREALVMEVRRMARVYQVEPPQTISAYFHLWAKAEKEQVPDVHLLIYHLLEVGECTLALWKSGLSEQTRQALARALSLDVDSAGRALAFWAALHDLGKAAPGFQRKYEPRIGILEGVGFAFPPKSELSSNPAPHGVVSAWALTDLLVSETGLSLRLAGCIAAALGGHHGAWPTSDRLQSPALQKSDKGNETWDAARKEIFRTLKSLYQPPSAIGLPIPLDERNAFLTLFTGLVSVADWIGSMENHFPFVDEFIPPTEYAQRAARRAKTALEKLGWLGWQADGSRLTFATMFPETPNPRPIQQQTFAAALESDLPALAILEAPTGIGKTEAALYLADAWLQRQKGSGLYIAMPTQATSNQMYDRTIKFLRSRYPEQAINAHLIHGGALLAEEATPQPQGIAQDAPAAEATVRAEGWFLPRKRTLLAPFGVGTVDQALMSVLQTRHFFVRLFGLGQKVVMFDEIHAYDTYMSELFQRLLPWLRSIGTSAILLSATLPEKTRRALVAAWLGQEEEDVNLPAAEYPRLTLAGGSQVSTVSLPPPPSRPLKLDWLDPAPEQIAAHLAEKLRDGGCAAVICNRVKRAQEVYAALQGVVEPENLILFHARFPFAWRKKIEDRVLDLFAKDKKHPNQRNPRRPTKAIVVATQVIEQSLDLDFDYMISDLAPVDLLLQRAGRLQRHSQNAAARPENLKQPMLAIARPAEKDNLPDFTPDARIYDAVTLLRTWLTIRGHSQITLPQETAALIEQVYPLKPNDDQFDPVYQPILRAAAEKARLGEEKDIYNAKMRLIPHPGYEGLLTDRNEGLEEDDPKAGDAFRALTRLGDPSVSIICLHKTPQGIALEPDGSGAPVDITQRPDFSRTKELLRRAVSVQRRDVVNYMVSHDERTVEWKKSAAVRDHYPVIFEPNGEYHPQEADFTLKLSREFGLEVLPPSIPTQSGGRKMV